MHQVICAGCGERFQAKTTRAKWHDAACRKRAQRAASTAESPPKRPRAAKKATAGRDRPQPYDLHGLVISTRTALEEAGKLDTFAGQLALQLARKLANPDESGISSLSKELRTVMDDVLGGGASTGQGKSPSQPADGRTSPPAGEPDDEVTRARKAREDARQAAGRS